MPAVMIDACGPKSPDSHRVVWGLTSWPPVPVRAFLRFPVCPPGSSPFARLPLVSRRPAFSGSSPSAVAPVPVPLRFPSGFPSAGNAHASAAAGRFRRRWSRAAGTKVTSSATAPCLDRAIGPHYIYVQHPTASCAAALPVPGRSSRSLTIDDPGGPRSRPRCATPAPVVSDTRSRSARAGKAHARAAGEPGGNEHGTELVAALGGGTAVTGPACGGP
jgi:hypothetical protein